MTWYSCSSLLTLMVAFLLGKGIWHAHRQAKRWRHTLLFLVELAVQWLNLLFYIMPNVYLLLHRCEFFADIFKWCGWLSWTCWNTVSHSPCILLHDARDGYSKSSCEFVHCNDVSCMHYSWKSTSHMWDKQDVLIHDPI